MSTDTRQQQQRTPNEYDREKEVKKFDESKLGVKGLLDSDVSHIPPFFYFPPQSLLDLSFSRSNQNDIIPLIDLSAPHPHVVDRVRAAAASSGFFQVVNHSVPVTLLDELIEGVKAFHELPSEEKADHYTRDMQNDVAFFSNIDLLASKAASWRDTLMIRLGPIVAQSNSIPHVCREAVIEWEKEVTKVGEQVMGLLSEGLGLKANKLKEMDCLANRVMVGHYYPYCPEPDKTIGITAHTDPGVVTVLVQDRVGGLQVKVGEEWVNVSRVRGALVVNVGDLLQMISNNEYKSAEHRVLANNSSEPRVSIGVFFNPSMKENWYGPLSELVTPVKPALYQQFTYSRFISRFFAKEIDEKSVRNYLRHQNE